MGLQELHHKTFAHVAARIRSRYARRTTRRARFSPRRIIRPIALMPSKFIANTQAPAACPLRGR